MAMETQLSNLLQSLFETDGEKFMKTSTFYAMKLYRDHLEQYLAQGLAETLSGDLDLLSSVSEDCDRVTLTAVNRGLDSTAKMKLSSELSEMEIVKSDVLNAENVRAFNTYDTPFAICDRPFDTKGRCEIELPAHSIVRLVFEKKK